MIKPLNNNCLIEVTNDYDGIVGGDTEHVQKGVLKDVTFSSEHLTASTGHVIQDTIAYKTAYEDMLGSTVYWQEYADAGSKFTIDGKEYVLVPFYRLIGFEE